MSEKLVPKLRFKADDGSEFSGWEKLKYGDILEFLKTNSLSREYLNYDIGLIKNVHYGDIHTKFKVLFDVEKENVPYINPEVNLKNIKQECYLQEGDILIADASEDYNDIGKSVEVVHTNNEKILSGLHTYLARPIDKLNIASGYLGHYLQTWNIRYQVMTIAQGTKVLGISKGNLAKVEVNLPSLPEQQKIADFLTAVDKRIELLTKKHRELLKYKKGLMQKIFSQEIRFKADDGSEFSGWERKKFGEITEKISIKNKKGEDLPVYSISNKYGFIPQGEQFEGIDSSGRGYDTTMYKIVGPNTFAYNPARINVGSLGYSYDLKKVIISSLYVCFKTIEEVSDSFLLFYLDSFHFNKDVKRNVEGGVREYLFYENFSGIKIDLPSLPEQQKIADFLTAVDKKIEKLEVKIQKTKEFKKGLLQQMFI